jgi:hypothetical protein
MELTWDRMMKNTIDDIAEETCLLSVTEQFINIVIINYLVQILMEFDIGRFY